MPALSFFADSRDAVTLVDWLNRDSEIAFIVPDGPPDPHAAYVRRLRASPGASAEAATLYPCFALADAGQPQRWKAVRSVDRLPDGKHSLWHVPAGPLPLPSANGHAPPDADLWAGWTGAHPGADPTLPDFGPGHPAEIYLELWTRQCAYSRAERSSLPALLYYWMGERELLVVSTFGWIGDHWGEAPQTTWSWWRRLEGWVAAHAVQIGMCRSAEEEQKCWAFPSALAKLRRGMAYEMRGWELTLFKPVAT